MGCRGKGWAATCPCNCTPDSLLPGNLWLPGDAQYGGQGRANVVNRGSGFPRALLEARFNESRPEAGAGREATTYVNGAAEERAFLQSLLDDPEQVGRSLPQLIPLSDASGEVLEALGGGAP